jgi:lipopolysaccharide transport system ATP-binding protein
MIGSIQVQNISKFYKQFNHRWAHIIHLLSGGWLQQPKKKPVLKNINFNVRPGEAVGIIGQNGSGKSTLLKIIAGIVSPTQGNIACSGEIAALLELGMGFNPEFTGRQNAIMACQLRGLTNKTIQNLLPQIYDFAEIGSYFDRPLRTYSSGMQVRLAFSAATAIRPDILIVDEALSVGDVYFQHKSISRIREFKEQGTTLFFVSHDAAAVKTLCDRAILLDKGDQLLDDNPENVINYYNALIAQKEKDLEIKQIESQQKITTTRSGNGKAKIRSIEIFNEQNESSRAFLVGEVATITCKIEYFAKVDEPTFGLVIRDRLGNNIFGTNTFYLSHTYNTPGLIEITFKIKLNLGLGSYSLTLASHSRSSHVEDNHDWWDNSIIFEMIPANHYQFVGVSYLPIEVFSQPLSPNGI